jgi:hypothetical protein
LSLGGIVSTKASSSVRNDGDALDEAEEERRRESGCKRNRTRIRRVLGRLLGLALFAAAVAAFVASRRRDAAHEVWRNGGSRQRSEQLRRELERQ